MTTSARRGVGRGRLLRARLRAAPLQVLALLGRLSGLTRRADQAIAAACEGCLFKNVSEVRRCTTAIVPGAYVFPDGTPSNMLADRLAAALALFEAGKVERVLVSGGPDEVVGMRAWLETRGVARVMSDPAGLRTWATMWRAAQMGVTEAVVCTQRFHLARSVYLARAAGIDAIGLVADARIYGAVVHNTNREACARIRALLDVKRASTRSRRRPRS